MNSIINQSVNIQIAKDLAKVMQDVYQNGDEVLKQETVSLFKDIIKEELK